MTILEMSSKFSAFEFKLQLGIKHHCNSYIVCSSHYICPVPTEFEARTVSYGPSFFLFDLWRKLGMELRDEIGSEKKGGEGEKMLISGQCFLSAVFLK